MYINYHQLIDKLYFYFLFLLSYSIFIFFHFVIFIIVVISIFICLSDDTTILVSIFEDVIIKLSEGSVILKSMINWVVAIYLEKRWDSFNLYSYYILTLDRSIILYSLFKHINIPVIIY